MKTSVQIALYNTGKYLDTCIKSVLRGVPEDAEILITDDCSTDNSAEIAAKLAVDNPRLRFEHSDVNRGIAATRAWMAENTDAEFIVVFDSDDIMLPGFVPRALQQLERAPDAAMIYGKTLPFDSTPENKFIPLGVKGFDSSYFALAFHNPFVHSVSIIRRKNLLACGNYQRLPERPATDYYLWTRLLETGDMIFDDRYSSLYRQHQTQITNVKKDLYPPMVEFAQNAAINRHPELMRQLTTEDCPDIPAAMRRTAMFLLGIHCHRMPEGSPEYLRDLTLAVQIDPTDYLPMLQLAGVLLEQNRIEPALEINLRLQQMPLCCHTMIHIFRQYSKILEVMGCQPDEATQQILKQEQKQRQEMEHVYRRSLEQFKLLGIN